jgi:Zn-finger nucleic acid-binding protein
MKIVERFKVKKKLLGGYKVAYKCPYCFESLTSQESEIVDEEECPECGGVFKIAESALTTIESLKLQSGDQTNLSQVAINKDSGLSFNNKNNTLQETEFTLKFMNQVPLDEVQEIESEYDGQRITAKYKILKDGPYVFVGGQIGSKDSKGQDTFKSGSWATQWRSGLKGKIVTVDIPVEITEGYWAIGVFKNISDIPVSSEFQRKTNRLSIKADIRSQISMNLQPLILVLMILTLPLGIMYFVLTNPRHYEYSYDSPTPSFRNSSNYGSSSSDFDTSEFSRRLVTDQMIRQGADPVEAEAFTSELYKAQREWERNKK